jgi:amino acid transporter
MGTRADFPELFAEAPATFQPTLNWKSGFWLAVVVPIGGLLTVGYEIGALGAYGALAVWVATSIIAVLQNYIFADLAGTYAGKPGGIALYASDIWSRTCAPLGGILGWGYWAGWSLVLAVGALIVGDLVQGEWFPGATWSFAILGAHVGLPTFVGAAVLVGVYLLNISGLKLVVDTNIVLGSAVLLLAVVCIIGPVVLGQLHGELTFHAGVGPWQIFVTLFTWAFLASWTAYGTEIAATFTPEYRNPRTDVARALRSSALLVLLIVALASTVFPAAVGEQVIAANPVGFFDQLVTQVVGRSFSYVVVVIICGAAVVTLGSATSDSARALYGMAADGLTARQLHRLNRAGQPARAMTVDLLFNLVVLFLVGNVSGIIFASNFGYLLSVVFALAGFVMLRRRRGDEHSSFHLGPIWVPIACTLVAINAVIIAVGMSHPDLIGYGGPTARIIGLSVIPVGLLSYFLGTAVQKGVRGQALWRRRD